MNSRVELPYWLIIVCTVFVTFSLLHGYLTIAARGWIWIPLACASCLLIDQRVLRSKQFFWLIVYFIILLIQMIGGKGSITNNYLTLNILTLFWATAFPFLLKRGVSRSFSRTFIIAELFVVVITSILTIIVDLRVPGVVRQVVTFINMGRADQAFPFYRLGVCEYAFPHAIPIIIPALIHHIRRPDTNKKNSILTMLLVIILLYLVFISGVTTAILLSFFAFIASFLISKERRTKTYIRLAVLIVISLPLVSKNAVLSALSGLESIVPAENSFHGKIVSIENTIIYDEAEGSVEAREDKYTMSWEAFKSNPFLGANSNSIVVGGHSFILDTFGAFGLLAGIPLLLFMFYHLRFIYRIIPHKSKTTFFIGSICFVAMLAIKNMSNVYTWLFVSAFLPMLLMKNNDDI